MAAQPPADQAAGLRRLFPAHARRHLALPFNPYVAYAGLAIDRIARSCAAAGQQVLVVDAAETSLDAPEAAAIDLALCIEPLAPGVALLPARGLPLRHVDTRGSSAALLDALDSAAPWADVVLMHASAGDLARVYGGRALRPLLLGADRQDSIQSAYASMKLLAHRCGWLSADLLLLAAPNAPRLPSIASRFASALDQFLGAALVGWTALDPTASGAEDDRLLQRVLQPYRGDAAEARAPAAGRPAAPAHPAAAQLAAAYQAAATNAGVSSPY